jgi:uncharacterized membrane protein
MANRFISLQNQTETIKIGNICFNLSSFIAMLPLIIFALLALVLVIIITMTYKFYFIEKSDKESEDENAISDHQKEKLSSAQSWLYAALVMVIISMIACFYWYVKGSPWEAHLIEWLNIVVRVMHITFGIAWIGASFYFIFLENALNRTKDLRDELAGNLWAVHGGGFYYLEKYKIAPKKIPKELHWFKYEAYFTWLSGFSLLFIVYYFNASAFLIDKNVLDISPLAGIGIGVGSFVVAWILYDLLCKTPLVKRPEFAWIGFALLVGFAYFYSSVFSARAAYIHFGAMIGTLMAANVFFIIIPSQKAMVKAAKENKPLDPQLGKNAGLRSLHNNYFTLPVLFVMVSNHFPSTFGYKYPWLILVIISLGAAGIKHYLNIKERGQYSIWVMPVSVTILLAAAFISAPPKDPGACNDKVNANEVYGIVTKRCVACHAKKPTDETVSAPPNGVVYESAADVAKLKDKIMQRVVITKTMPQNNKTGMTEEERNIIRCWIEQGASLK